MRPTRRFDPRPSGHMQDVLNAQPRGSDRGSSTRLPMSDDLRQQVLQRLLIAGDQEPQPRVGVGHGRRNTAVRGVAPATDRNS